MLLRIIINTLTRQEIKNGHANNARDKHQLAKSHRPVKNYIQRVESLVTYAKHEHKDLGNNQQDPLVFYAITFSIHKTSKG